MPPPTAPGRGPRHGPGRPATPLPRPPAGRRSCPPRRTTRPPAARDLPVHAATPPRQSPRPPDRQTAASVLPGLSAARRRSPGPPVPTAAPEGSPPTRRRPLPRALSRARRAAVQRDRSAAPPCVACRAGPSAPSRSARPGRRAARANRACAPIRQFLAPGWPATCTRSRSGAQAPTARVRAQSPGTCRSRSSTARRRHRRTAPVPSPVAPNRPACSCSRHREPRSGWPRPAAGPGGSRLHAPSARTRPASAPCATSERRGRPSTAYRQSARRRHPPRQCPRR